MRKLQDSFETNRRRLLRILFLWNSEMPSFARRKFLLLLKPVVNTDKLEITALRSFISWSEKNEKIRGLILSGSRVAKNSKVDFLSDYDIAVVVNDIDFIKNDQWLNELQEYWVCVHDEFDLLGFKVPTRLVIFNDELKIDFSFLMVQIFNKISSSGLLPDNFNLGYKILLDKDSTLNNLPTPTFKAFLLDKPSEADFNRNVNEFWFEVYHATKYLTRNDLWVAKFRDWSTKQFLLQMLQWYQGSKNNWDFSPKSDGKEMMNWVDSKILERLNQCFGAFEKESSWRAIENTTRLYREVAKEVSQTLNYHYNQSLDTNISEFIDKMKASHLK
jgi:aminoglycoside 6-adenylyltransferase